MKHKRLIAGILIAALVFLCVASLAAAWQGVRMFRASGVRFDLMENRLAATATEEQTLSVGGAPHLTVTNDVGNVTVKGGGPEGQVSITAEKTAWVQNQTQAEAALADIEVVVEQTGDEVSVSVEQPTVVNVYRGEQLLGSVDFVIVVPEETTVSLTSMSGSLGLNGTSGDASLSTDFGSIAVASLSGRLEARSVNGEVTAQGVDSPSDITLASEFGSVTLTSAAAQDVRLGTTNGRIEVADVHSEGPLVATTQFGGITAGDSSASSAEFRSDNGEVQLERLTVGETIVAHSDFGNISLDGVDAAGYDLSGQNGKISVDGAGGPVKAHTDMGSVEIVNAVEAVLDLAAGNGGITFSGSLGDGAQMLQSDFGSIELTLPADVALTVDLQTQFGRITSDFNIAVEGEIDNSHVQGTINGGGSELTAETQNGSIVLISSDE